MTQPPQDRPDYPWGPSESDRGQRAAAAEQAPTGGGGSTRMGDPAQPASSAPTSGPEPAPAPYTGTPHPGPAEAPRPSASTPAPYTGTRMDQLPPLGPPTQGGYGQGGYAGTPAHQRGGDHGTTPVSTIVLLVTSGIVLLVTLASVVGVVFAAPVVLAVVALTRASSDPASARRLTRIGWWIFAGLLVLGLVLIVLLIVLAVSFADFTTTGGFGGNDPFATTAALGALAGAGR